MTTSAGIISLIPQKCELCGSRGGLLRCSGCQVAYYCSGDRESASPSLPRYRLSGYLDTSLSVDLYAQQIKNSTGIATRTPVYPPREHA